MIKNTKSLFAFSLSLLFVASGASAKHPHVNSPKAETVVVLDLDRTAALKGGMSRTDLEGINEAGKHHPISNVVAPQAAASLDIREQSLSIKRSQGEMSLAGLGSFRGTEFGGSIGTKVGGPDAGVPFEVHGRAEAGRGTFGDNGRELGGVLSSLFGKMSVVGNTGYQGVGSIQLLGGLGLSYLILPHTEKGDMARAYVRGGVGLLSTAGDARFGGAIELGTILAFSDRATFDVGVDYAGQFKNPGGALSAHVAGDVYLQRGKDVVRPFLGLEARSTSISSRNEKGQVDDGSPSIGNSSLFVGARAGVSY